MNKRQKEVYAALLATPPKSDKHGWGAAYWMGFRNPSLPVDRAGPIVGVQGSEARGAYLAGRVASKRAQGDKS